MTTWLRSFHPKDSQLISISVSQRIQVETDAVQNSSPACAKLHIRPALVIFAQQSVASNVRLSYDFTQFTSPLRSLLLHDRSQTRGQRVTRLQRNTLYSFKYIHKRNCLNEHNMIPDKINTVGGLDCLNTFVLIVSDFYDDVYVVT